MISRTRKVQLLLEIENKDSRKLKRFQKILELMSQSPYYNLSKQSQGSASRKDFYQETDQGLGISICKYCYHA